MDLLIMDIPTMQVAKVATCDGLPIEKRVDYAMNRSEVDFRIKWGVF